MNAVSVGMLVQPIFPMPTTRIYNNNKRVATGVDLKNGSFYQVYPSKQTFPSEAAWRTQWTTTLSNGIRFVSTDVNSKSASVTVTNVLVTPVAPPPPKKKVDTREWTFKPIKERTFPAGKYYVGDICYALDDATYDTAFGGHHYEDGFYSCKDGEFMVAGTAYGDGSYPATNGKSYAVDAGVIGIVSEGLIDKNSGSLCGGHIHTFKQPVTATFKGGVFKFSSQGHSFTIDTAGNDNDNYYEDSE